LYGCKKTVGAKLSSYQAQIIAIFHAQQDGTFALTEKKQGNKRPVCSVRGPVNWHEKPDLLVEYEEYPISYLMPFPCLCGNLGENSDKNERGWPLRCRLPESLVNLSDEVTFAARLQNRT